MAKKTSTVATKSRTVQSSTSEAMLLAIDTERQRVFRARALVQVAAKLSHELTIPERGEADIGFVLDVAADLLETSLTRLDRAALMRCK